MEKAGNKLEKEKIDNKSIIGITEYVEISGRKGKRIPAKIDSGADSSAIWASKIRVDKDGVLKFSLFGEGSEFYNGKIFKRTSFSVARIKSSNGDMQYRYRVKFRVKIGEKVIITSMNLSDRSTQLFPILIGRKTIYGKFLVDVSKGAIAVQKPKKVGLNDELTNNPYEFHKKYVKIKKKKGLNKK